MTLTLRKVRNKNEYVIKDNGKIVTTLESREEAVDYFVKYREKSHKEAVDYIDKYREETENKVEETENKVEETENKKKKKL